MKLLRSLIKTLLQILEIILAFIMILFIYLFFSFIGFGLVFLMCSVISDFDVLLSTLILSGSFSVLVFILTFKFWLYDLEIIKRKEEKPQIDQG